LNLDDVRSECITITFAEEGPARVHVCRPKKWAAAGAATDWNVVAQQIESLQKRLDEIGPVNLVAIEEYERRSNVTNSSASNMTTWFRRKPSCSKSSIASILKPVRMFRTTFEQIRDNFRAMFTEVFGGGQSGP